MAALTREQADRHGLAIEWRPTDSLTPWEGNYKRHPDSQLDRLARVVRSLGWTNPILVDLDDRIVAGHARHQMAQRESLPEVPTIRVQARGDEALQIALADNRLAELADDDEEALAQVLQRLRSQDADVDALGWDDREFKALVARLNVAPPPSDEAPPPPATPVSRPGEVYQLGPHRLICGDSADPEVWKRLLGDEQVDTIQTDPPYGINYSGKGITAAGVQANDFGPMLGDDDTQIARRVFEATRDLRADSEVWWGANYYCDALPGGSGWLVWNKEVVGEVYSAAELAWTTLRGRIRMLTHQWHGMVRASERGPRLHPTQKPVALIAWALEQVKAGRIVADAFAGSGTTLIACARTGRVARCVELDPRYVDVIRQRWTRWAREAGQDPGPGALD